MNIDYVYSEVQNINPSYNVDYFTGTLNLNVPLYTMQSGDVSIPITLNYRGAGIRSNGDSYINNRLGASWQLVAGGTISRIINGKHPNQTCTPSDCTNGDVQAIFQKVFYSYGTEDRTDAYNDIDTEPDFYSFSLPDGTGGIFMLTANGNKGYTLPYQDLDITISSDSKIFTIIDARGTIYKFSNPGYYSAETYLLDQNNVVQNGGQPISTVSKCVTTWHLTDMTTIQGQTAKFSYTNFSFGTNPFSYSYIVASNNNPAPTKLRINNHYEDMYLSKIETDKEIVNFYSSLSIETYGLDLCSIKISNKKTNETIKKILLNKSPIGGTIDSNSILGGKNLLNSIEETIGTKTREICSFEYYPGSIPTGLDLNSDAWGFYNGKNNQTSCPSYSSYSGADRRPSFDYTLIGAMKSLTMPTGGRIEFDYSLHSSTIGGLRISAVRSVDPLTGKSSTTTYQYSTPVAKPPRFGYSTNGGYPFSISDTPMNKIYDLMGRYVYYQTVTEIYPNGNRTVYTFKINQNKPSIIYSCDGNGNTNLSKYNNDNSSATTSNEFTSYDDPDFWKNGILLSATQYEKLTNKIISLTQYDYDPSPPAKLTLYSYPYCVYFDHYWWWNWLGTVSKDRWSRNAFMVQCSFVSEPVLLNKITTTGFNIPKTEVAYTYNTDYMVPTKITKTDGENNVTETELYYNFDYHSYYSNYDYPLTNNIYQNPGSAMYDLVDRHAFVPVEQITTLRKAGEATSKVIAGAVNEYYYCQTGTKYGLVLHDTKTLALDAPIDRNALVRAYISSDYDSFICDPHYQTTDVYSKYNSNAQVTYQYNTQTLDDIAYIYDPDYFRPIAEIKHAVSSESNTARENQVFHTSFEELNGTGNVSVDLAKTGNNVHTGNYTIDLRYFCPGDYILSYWQSKDGGATWSKMIENVSVNTSTSSYTIQNGYWIDELRLAPARALMTTCTYSSVGNVTSTTDNNSNTNYMEYDDLGRLVCVKDNDRQVLKRYIYNTKVQ